MASGHEETHVPNDPSTMVGSVRNIGEPLRFSHVEPLVGFAAGAAQEGQVVKVWTKLALTSDVPLFHRLVENFANAINHMAQQKGVGVNLRRADTVLLVIKPDACAELWVDTAAVTIRCAVKRALAAVHIPVTHEHSFQ
ncbi:MAG TPA: hypothetical protein VK149_09450 [Sideroxyarcus sp.]|nr:hypothetical protein [Sideroxyarcus sp.]